MIKQPIGVADNICNDEFGEINNQVNLPMFKYIYQNPNVDSIPEEIIMNYTGERNFVGQTPLMYAVKIGNINFIRQLLEFDICKLDDEYKSALDYAYQFNASNDIVTLLEEYEYNTDDE